MAEDTRPTDPLRNFRFNVEIQDLSPAGFSEVTGYDVSNDAIDYRAGNDAVMSVRKLPGMTKYSNITLKWGITANLDLYEWHQAVVDGDVQRKQVIITVINYDGTDGAVFEIEQAWPSKYDPMDLTAKGNDVGIETLELCHEGVRRTK